MAKQQLKHQYFAFDSGYCMIDIWKGNKYYTIQRDPNSIGVSLINHNIPDFSSIPDVRFHDFNKFTERLTEILKTYIGFAL
jgi:hypothetical protein